MSNSPWRRMIQWGWSLLAGRAAKPTRSLASWNTPRRRRSGRANAHPSAALESRILLTNTLPTIDSLAFTNPSASNGSANGNFVGSLTDDTPGSYYTIEIDTNNDQLSDVSGMSGGPGSYSVSGSMPIGTTSVQARVMESVSETGQYEYGSWQTFAVSDGFVVNTLPTIATLTFANPSASYGSVNGNFAGSLTDATPSSYYTIEIDTNNDQMSDVSSSIYPGNFNVYGSMPLGTTSVKARAVEYVTATGQYVSGNWQTFTISDGVVANTLPTIESLTFSNPYVSSGTVSGTFTGSLADATPSSDYTIEIDTNNDQMSDVSSSIYPGNFNVYGSMPLGTTSVKARAVEYVSATGQYVSGNWQTFTVSDGVVANTLPTIESLTFANPMASSGSVSGEFAGSLTDATPGSYYTLEIDTNGDQMANVSGSAYPGSYMFYGSMPVGTTTIHARVIEVVSATGRYAYGSWQEFTVTGTGSTGGGTTGGGTTDGGTTDGGTTGGGTTGGGTTDGGTTGGGTTDGGTTGGGITGGGTTGGSVDEVQKRYDEAMAATKSAFQLAINDINQNVGKRDEVRAAKLAEAKVAADTAVTNAIQATRDSYTNSEQEHLDKLAEIDLAIADTEQKGQAYEAAVAKLNHDEQTEKATATAVRDHLVAQAKADKEAAFQQAEAALTTAGEQIGAAYDTAIETAQAGYDAALETATQTFTAAAEVALNAANTAIESAQSGYNSALSSAASARDTATAGLSQTYDPMIVNLDSDYQMQLYTEIEAFRATLDGILDGFADQIQALQDAYYTSVRSADDTFEGAIETADDDFDDDIKTAFDNHKGLVDNAVDAFDTAVEGLNTSFDNTVETASTTYDTEIGQANTDYTTEMDRLTTEYETEIDRATGVKDTFYATKPQEYADNVKIAAQAWADAINAAQKAYRDQMPGIAMTHLDALISAVSGLANMGDSGIEALRTAANAAIQVEANSARDVYLNTMSQPFYGNFSEMQNAAVLAYVRTVGAKATTEYNTMKTAIMALLNDLKPQIVAAVTATGDADVAYTIAERNLFLAILEADEMGQSTFMSAVAGLQSGLLTATHQTEATFKRDVAAATRKRDDGQATAAKKRSLDKSIAGKKFVDAVADAERTYVKDYTTEWGTLQGKLMDARDAMYTDIGTAETTWTTAINTADQTWVNTTTSATTSYSSGVVSSRTSTISSITSALNSHQSNVYTAWIAAMQRAYPNATDLSAFTSAWESYAQTATSSWSTMTTTINAAVNNYDTSITAASNAHLMSAAQAGHSAASAMAQAEATRLTAAAQALRTFDTSRTQAAIKEAKDKIQAETNKDQAAADAEKKKFDGLAVQYESIVKDADAKIEQADNSVTNVKQTEGTRFIGNAYTEAQTIQAASAANSAIEANELRELAKAEAETVRGRVIAATEKILSERIAEFERILGNEIQKMQDYISALGAQNTSEILQELSSLQTAAGQGYIPGCIGVVTSMWVLPADAIFVQAKAGAKIVFDGATAAKLSNLTHPLTADRSGGMRADRVFRELLGLTGDMKIPLVDQDGDHIGFWDVEAGLVSRVAPNLRGGASTKTLTYDEVMTFMNGPGQTATPADWNGRFGFSNSNTTPTPGTETWSYKMITFVIDEEKLAAPGGLASDVMITIHLATEIVGMVDPTGVSDVINAGVCILEGDYTAATIAVASIAVPFGAEKLAKAVRRAPIGQVDTLVKSMNTAADLAKGRVDDVVQTAGPLKQVNLAKKAEAPSPQCLTPGNCFTPGHRIVIKGDGDSLAVVDENNREVHWAVGLFVVGGMLHLLRSQLPATGPNQRRSKRRRHGEWDEVLV